MAEEMERYRAKVNFQHKFENFKRRLQISSPTFFARNLPFCLNLFRNLGDKARTIFFALTYEGEEEGVSINVEFVLSLITPSKTIQSEEFACTLDGNYYKQMPSLSELFPGQEIIVDDTITIKISLWVGEPKGVTEYKPPKEKLRQELQISENQVQCDAFASLLDSGDLSDVTFVIKVDSSKVKAHKAILVGRSQVFARMLTTEMREAKNNEIVIDDMGGNALKIMLHHIYTGQLGFPEGIKIDLKICQELVNAGEKYELQNLKEYAAMAMTEFVSMENAWELFVFAKRLQAKAATKALTSYYKENVDKIMKMV